MFSLSSLRVSHHCCTRLKLAKALPVSMMILARSRQPLLVVAVPVTVSQRTDRRGPCYSDSWVPQVPPSSYSCTDADESPPRSCSALLSDVSDYPCHRDWPLSHISCCDFSWYIPTSEKPVSVSQVDFKFIINRINRKKAQNIQYSTYEIILNSKILLEC